MSNGSSSPGAAGRGPLADVRVLDLTRVLAGPWATTLLADLGAEIVKVEEPRVGDSVRHTPPVVRGISSHFVNLNRGKQSICVDLKSPEGRQIILDLARVSDVIVENFRPGVIARLGLDYETIVAVNPKIIYCSISGFGQSGPLRDNPSFDVITQAMSGAMSVTGEEGQRPVRLGVPLGDLSGGIYGALGILAALHEREQTGYGSYLDIGILDCMVNLMLYYPIDYLVTGKNPRPVGGRHNNIAPYGVFEVADGHIVLAIFQSKFWRAFCKAADRQDLAEDPRFRTTASRFEHRDILYPIVEGIMLERPRDEWADLLTAAGVPNGPINTMSDVVEHPHVKAREMIATVEHPSYGSLPITGRPIKFPGRPQVPLGPAPVLGEDTETVLRSILGYDDARIRALIADGVAGRAESADRGRASHGG